MSKIQDKYIWPTGNPLKLPRKIFLTFGVFALALIFGGSKTQAYCIDYITEVDAVRSRFPSCLKIEGGVFCGGGLKVTNNCNESVMLENNVILPGQYSYPYYGKVIWNFSSANETQSWELQGKYQGEKLVVNGVTKKPDTKVEISRLLNLVKSRFYGAIPQIALKLFALLLVLYLLHLIDNDSKTQMVSTLVDPEKPQRSKVVNFYTIIIGICAFGILYGGFVGATGGIRAFSKGDIGFSTNSVFGHSIIFSYALAVMPLLLIKDTLGKYIKYFNLSNKAILLYTLSLALSWVIIDAIRLYNLSIYLEGITNNIYTEIDSQYKRNFEIVSSFESKISEMETYEAGFFKDITRARNRYLASTNLNEKTYAANAFDMNVHSIIVLKEEYPDLQTNSLTTEYISKLIEMENEINSNKKVYNSVVKDLNAMYRSFPELIFINAFGLEKRPYFEYVK